MIQRPSAFGKLDHVDFGRRVKRVDPRFHRMGDRAYAKDTTKPNAVGAALIGFGWAYIVAAIGSNRAHIEASLGQGALSAQTQYWIVSVLAALLAASLVMLAVHLVRVFLTKGARRKNSRALLVGALAAFCLFYTPQVVWTTGFGMLDGHSQDFLASAGEMVEGTFPGLGIDQFRFSPTGF
jgi:hypothetical protein